MSKYFEYIYCIRNSRKTSTIKCYISDNEERVVEYIEKQYPEKQNVVFDIFRVYSAMAALECIKLWIHSYVDDRKDIVNRREITIKSLTYKTIIDQCKRLSESEFHKPRILDISMLGELPDEDCYNSSGDESVDDDHHRNNNKIAKELKDLQEPSIYDNPDINNKRKLPEYEIDDPEEIEVLKKRWVHDGSQIIQQSLIRSKPTSNNQDEIEDFQKQGYIIKSQLLNSVVNDVEFYTMHWEDSWINNSLLGLEDDPAVVNKISDDSEDESEDESDESEDESDDESEDIE